MVAERGTLLGDGSTPSPPFHDALPRKQKHVRTSRALLPRLNIEDVVLQRCLFVFAALLVGFVSAGYTWCAKEAGFLFTVQLKISPFLCLATCPVGLAAIAWMTKTFFPGSQGSGIPQAIASLQVTQTEAPGEFLSWRIAIGKFLLTALGFAFGASIGKEGPTVQIGCVIMYRIGRWRLPESHRLNRLLILSGAAAGITAAFNAPIAGAIFAIEEMAREFDPRHAPWLILATVLAGIALRATFGDEPYFGVVNGDLALAFVVPTILSLGVGGGLLGGAFAWFLAVPVKRYPLWLRHLVQVRPVIFAALCGVFVAVAGLLSNNHAFGSGYAETQAALSGTQQFGLRFALLKWIASLASYLSGIPGGIFAPSLSIGASLGAGMAVLFPYLPASAMSQLGMAAYFSGVVRAPFTAAVIVVEMTGDLAMSVPVILAALLGDYVSRLFNKKPLYGLLAERFLTPDVAKPAETLADVSA